MDPPCSSGLRNHTARNHRFDMLSLLLLITGTTGVLSQILPNNFTSVPECAAGCVIDAILGTACDSSNVRHITLRTYCANEVLDLLRLRKPLFHRIPCSLHASKLFGLGPRQGPNDRGHHLSRGASGRCPCPVFQR
jgi:hypothetical protein